MRKSFVLLNMIAAMLLANACSTIPHEIDSEKMDSSWNSQSYKNLLVVGIYKDRPFRISNEISFSEELKSKGILATPSYDLFAELSVLDDAAVIRDVTSSNSFDALLTVATTNVNEEFTYGDALATRGMVRLLGGEPGAGTDAGILIAYLGSGTYALHIGLWDAKTQKLIWQATTHSVFQDSPSEEIKSLADLIAQKLRAKGLI